MASLLRVKNWTKFQHYRDRCPPWIKLATDTFQDIEFSRLQPASKLLAICIWTLASRSKDGTVPDDFDYIRQWGFLGDTIKRSHLNELINHGFVISASTLLAECEQSACLETEGEAETEGERETDLCTEPEKPLAHVPADFLLILNDKTYLEIRKEQIDRLRELYPSVEIEQQFRNMMGWLEANPTKRKTRRGVMKFVNSWMSREQDKPHIGSNGNGKSNGRKEGQLDRLFAKYETVDGQLAH